MSDNILPSGTLRSLQDWRGKLKIAFVDAGSMAQDPAAAGGDPAAGGAPPADPAMGGMPADPMAAGGAAAPPAPQGPDIMALLQQVLPPIVQQAVQGAGGGAGGAGGAAGAGGKPQKADVGLEIQAANRINRKILTLLLMIVKEMGLEIPPEIALEPDPNTMAPLSSLPAAAPPPMAGAPAQPGAAPAGGAPAAPQGLPAPFPQINPMQGFGGAGGGGGGGGGDAASKTASDWLGDIKGMNDALRALKPRRVAG